MTDDADRTEFNRNIDTILGNQQNIAPSPLGEDERQRRKKVVSDASHTTTVVPSEVKGSVPRIKIPGAPPGSGR